MNFAEIKKLTKVGNYEFTLDFDFFKVKIDGYVDDELLKLNLMPDFQRGHVWAIEQRIKYLEFIIRGGNPGILYFNKPDWGYFNGTGYNEFVIVDGLQRLTSIMMFLNNELPIFGCYLKDFDDADRLLRSVSILINVNNLKTKKEVLQWYLEMNSGGTPHTKEELDKVKNLLEKEQ